MWMADGFMKHKSDRMEEGRNGTMTQTTSIVTWRESMEVSIRVNLAMCPSMCSIHSCLVRPMDEHIMPCCGGETIWMRRAAQVHNWTKLVDQVRL